MRQCGSAVRRLGRGGFFLDFPNDAAGISGGDDVGGDVLGDDTAGPDDSTSPDFDARAYDCSSPNPDIISDFDRFSKLDQVTSFVCVDGVGGGVDVDSGGEHHVVPNADRSSIKDEAVEVEVDVVAECRVDPVVAEKR